jgi:ribose transport system permease protein
MAKKNSDPSSKVPEGFRGALLLGLSPRRLLTLGVFAALFILFSIFARHFFTVRNILNLLIQSSTFSIIAIGATLVMAVGGIDFSLGAVVALSGSAAAGFARAGLPVWLAMLAGMGLGALVGVANGLIAAKMRMPSWLATFAVAVLIGGLGGLRGGRGAYRPMPPDFGALANVPVLRIAAPRPDGSTAVIFPGLSWIFLIMLAVAFLFHFVLARTRIGRCAFLVGSNRVAARFSGIDTGRVKVLAYATAGLLAGLVGILLASRMGGPPGAGRGYEIIGIACAIIGGASLSGGSGSVGGAVVGSFILSVLDMGMTMMNVSPFLQTIIVGLVILVSVYLDRAGQRD